MRRAFVGFSSPIGYMYDSKAAAERTNNDQMSSPNPVLFGSMGLMTLYDEIWFACRSLCPQSMRQLPYVKYLDVDGGAIDLAATDFSDEIDSIYDGLSQPNSIGLQEMFPQGFGAGMTAYVGGEFATDNHTHGLSFRGVELRGSPSIRQLIT